jgi:hypothetical protein
VTLISAFSFCWVEFYTGERVTPIIRSFSIASNCENEDGFLSLIVQDDPEAELAAGLTGPAPCSDLHIIVPGLVKDVLSLSPGRRQAIPDAAIKITVDDINGTSIALAPNKLPNPSGLITFHTLLSRTSFDTYSIYFPIILNKADNGLHSPKRIHFSALIDGVLKITATQPSDLTATQKLTGQNMLLRNIEKNQDIYIELHSESLTRLKNLIQWVSGAFFGAAVAYILATVGLKI